ncbi:MAG: peptidylprolyl isomerase [Patescibacteria group bacterium]|jgi:cyclophilin family peptidyl-prolyl cis-trans isomerase|nr:peptidylprolyl isomerase [Patescibacteria group bacterium]
MGKAQKLKEQRKIVKLEKEKRKKNRRKLIYRGILGLFFVIIITSGVFFAATYAKTNWFNQKKSANNSDLKVDKVANSRKTYSKVPEMKIDSNKKYIAQIETNKGSFKAELDAKNTPITVNNFVFLSKEKFYDGLTFHRIVKGFMIQGGDPKGNGTGDPGYKFNDEKIVGDYTPGTLAMANSGTNTNGSQFFVMTGDYSSGKLPKNYVIFGKVISGMEVVQKIAAIPTNDNGQGEQSKPKETVTINKISIEES